MSFLTSQLELMLLLIVALLLSPHGRAQQTYFPAAVPLAVRSPYLTCWDYFTNGSTFGEIWPTTYTSNQVCMLYICFYLDPEFHLRLS